LMNVNRSQLGEHTAELQSFLCKEINYSVLRATPSILADNAQKKIGETHHLKIMFASACIVCNVLNANFETNEQLKLWIEY